MKINFLDLVHYLYEDTLIPELFKILGEETTLKFVKIFGGTRLDVPAYKKITDLQRNLDIYETLSACNNFNVVRRLAEKYDITEVWVVENFKKMQDEYPRINNFIQNRHSEIEITSRRLDNETRKN